MRGFGLFFGGSGSRNDPIELSNPRPLPRHTESLDTGNAGRDGYSVLAKANPDHAGRLPSVAGTVGRTYQGPDQSFEQ